jgi:hypothetical protein
MIHRARVPLCIPKTWSALIGRTNRLRFEGVPATNDAARRRLRYRPGTAAASGRMLAHRTRFVVFVEPRVYSLFPTTIRTKREACRWILGRFRRRWPLLKFGVVPFGYASKYHSDGGRTRECALTVDPSGRSSALKRGHILSAAHVPRATRFARSLQAPL